MLPSGPAQRYLALAALSSRGFGKTQRNTCLPKRIQSVQTDTTKQRRRTLASAAVAAALAFGAAAPATAGTGCASGYICYFDHWNNSTLRENHDTGDNWSFAGERWLHYNSDGTWYAIAGTDMDDAINAVNIQWNIDGAYFWTENGYTAVSSIVTSSETGASGTGISSR